MPHTPEVKSLLVEEESPGGKLAAIYLVAGENESTSSVCGCRIHRIESLQKGQSHVRMEFCPMHLAVHPLATLVCHLFAFVLVKCVVNDEAFLEFSRQRLR